MPARRRQEQHDFRLPNIRLFDACVPVTEVNLIVNRSTGQSRGFAFVTMATPEGAQAAIQGLAGKDLKGRAISVSEACPREEHTGGGAGGGRGGGRPQSRYWRLV
jgi:RNA recognition motif-containing protein